MIFDKIMKLKCTSIQYADVGKIVNLSTVDVMGIYQFSQYGSFIVTSPIMIVVSITLIIVNIGVSGLLGIVVLFISTIISGKVGFSGM
jgi:hypothetical protein